MSLIPDRDLAPRKKEGPGRGRIAGAVLVGLGLAFLARLVVHAWLVFPYAPAGDDMAPAFPADEVVYVWRGAKLEELKHGQTALFRHPELKDRYMLRRIIGLPGDQVQIADRRVYINNRPLDAHADAAASEAEIAAAAAAGYVGPPLKRGSLQRDNDGPVIVPEAQLYVLADNRAQALDSRLLGPLPVELIEGVVSVEEADSE